MKNSKITINVESLDNESIKANFTGGAKNFNELMSLGSAILNTFLASATTIIKNNDKDLDMPDEILKLTILDSLVDKIFNLAQTEKTDNTDNDTKADEFLNNIIKGMKGDEQ